MGRVLVIDDEESIRATLRLALTREGHTADTVSTLGEARTAFEGSSPDIIILDLWLARESGLDFLRYLKDQGSDTPVIVITGAPDVQGASESLRLGAFDYIAKPFTLEVLRGAVRRALERKRFVDERRELEREKQVYQDRLQNEFDERTAELQRRNVELATLNGLAAGLAHSRTLHDVVSVALDHALKVAGFSHGAVYLNHGGNLDLVMSKGCTREPPARLAAASPLMELTAASPVTEHDSDAARAFLSGLGMSHVVAVPLRVKERLAGILLACTADGTLPGTGDLALLSALGQQVAVALENIELVDETTRRAQELSSLLKISASTASALHIGEIIETLYQQLNQLMGVTTFLVALVNEADRSMDFVFVMDESIRQMPFSRPLSSGGFTEWIASTGQPLLIHDMEAESSRLPTSGIVVNKAPRSWLGLPLRTQDKTVGVMSVQSYQPNEFDERHLQLLQTIAGQIAVAIQNAWLFEEAVSQRQRTDAIIRNLAEGVLMLDNRGHFVDINPALEVLLSVKGSQIKGTSPEDIALDAPPNLQALCEIAQVEAHPGAGEDGKTPGVDVALGQPINRIVKVYSAEIRDSLDVLLGKVKVVRDVTRERELDQMKNDFVSIVSHELRTPVFHIRGFLELLLSGKAEDPATRTEFLHIIQEQTEGLRRLVEDLLDMSRIESGVLQVKLEKVPVADLVQQVVSKTAPVAAERGIELRASLPDQLPVIPGDYLRLTQVLNNLIGNALKFTKSGGTITVSAENRPDEVWLHVTDTGIGIPDKSLSHVFEKFYQVDGSSTRSVGGTGLGLHICKQIVERHGGRVWVESRVGVGSVFTVALPLQREPVVSPPTDHQREEAAIGQEDTGR